MDGFTVRRELPVGERLADRVAAIVGSRTFIVAFSVFLVAAEAQNANLHPKIDLLLGMAGEPAATQPEPGEGAR